MSIVLDHPRSSVSGIVPPLDEFYEVVDGQRVEVPPMGAQEVGIAGQLMRYIWLFWGENPSGLIALEMLFRLTGNGAIERRPDVAYVSFERCPQRVIPPGNAWEVVPDLAVEVVSPTNLALDLQTKIDDYFLHGVRQVWVIFPPQRRIYVYESIKSIRVLDANDVLDGAPVLPGFRLEVGKLFEVLPQLA